MQTPMPSTLLSFTQLLLITIVPFTSANLVNDTCKKTSYADLCISTLKSDPRSSTADTPTLGLIMVDKVDTIAKSTLMKIQDLLGKPPHAVTKQALTSCEESYRLITDKLVPPSKENLTKGDYRFAMYYMNSAASVVSDCEAGFGGKSPLSDSNDYENKVALVASDIASLLL